jgi:PPOX class probable F420-dependent enzyme
MRDPIEPPKEVQRLIRTGRVARLATVYGSGRPYIVPTCYAYDGSRVYPAVDDTPKDSSPRRPRRIVNIQDNPGICMIVDEYDEDWNRHRLVMIHGSASIALAGADHSRALELLRKQYPQYRTMALAENRNPVIAITPTRFVSWGRFG